MNNNRRINKKEFYILYTIDENNRIAEATTYLFLDNI